MLEKRGQLTLFIIIGILIIIVLGVIAYIRIEPESEVPQDVAPVNVFVQECLEEIGGQVVRSAGYYGGLFDVQENYITFNGKIPLYYNEGVTIPSRELIQQQLATEIEENFGLCINDFQELQGFTITAGEPLVGVVVTKESVIIDMDYEVIIDDSTLDYFSAEINLAMGKMYDVAEYLVSTQSELGICLTCHSRAAFDNNVKIDFMADEGYYIVIMKELEQDYYYSYAVNPGNAAPKAALEILVPSLQKAYRGNLYVYQMEAEEGVVFSDETDLFDISPEGEISFTPTEDDIGTYSIKINGRSGQKEGFVLFSMVIE